MDDLAVAAHEPPRFGVALPVAVGAVAGLLSTTVVPDLSAANRGLVLLYYLSLLAATALVLLAVAAPEVPAANRAADRLQGWVRRAMTRLLLLLLHLRVVRGRLIRAASFLLTAGGVAALVVYTTVPAGDTADPDPHLVMVCFLFFMAGILVVLLRVAAPDLTDDGEKRGCPPRARVDAPEEGRS